MTIINTIIQNIYRLYDTSQHNFFGINIDKDGKAYINNYKLNDGIFTDKLAESLISKISPDKLNKFVWILDQYTWESLMKHYDDTIQDIDARNAIPSSQVGQYQIIILNPIEEKFEKELNKYFIEQN